MSSVLPGSPGSAPLHLAVALDGAGWHPAAWREPAARPAELFTAQYWLDLVREAERGLLDLVTIEDSFGLQARGLDPANERTDEVRGRLDAVLIADRVAPQTHHIGLVPTVSATHTEPFHVSKAIATLDYVSTGRAGVRVQVSPRAEEARHFGRRVLPESGAADLSTPAAGELISELFGELVDYVEVIRRLWDSWEDDAEIRDAASGRFIDRDRLHYIDFHGSHFSVKGPSIVPRPPQGQPIVAALAHSGLPYRCAAASADIVFVTPTDTVDAGRIVAEVRAAQADIGRAEADLAVFADLVVFLDDQSESGADRKSRLDRLARAEYRSDARIFAGSAAALADLLAQWQSVGISGYRLRPGALPDDLNAITGALVPELQSRGLFRSRYEADSLRGLLGLERPANRYARAAAAPVAAEGVSA